MLFWTIALLKAWYGNNMSVEKLSLVGWMKHSKGDYDRLQHLLICCDFSDNFARLLLNVYDIYCDFVQL